MAELKITDTRASQALSAEENRRASQLAFRKKYQAWFLFLVFFFVGLLVAATLIYDLTPAAIVLGVLGVYFFSRILYNAVFGGRIRGRDVGVAILFFISISVDILVAGISEKYELEKSWTRLARPMKFRAALVAFTELADRPQQSLRKPISITPSTLQGLRGGATQLKTVWIAERPRRQSDLDDLLQRRMEIRRYLDALMTALNSDAALLQLLSKEPSHPVAESYQKLRAEWETATGDLPALQRRYDDAKAAYYAEIGRFPYNIFYKPNAKRFFNDLPETSD